MSILINQHSYELADVMPHAAPMILLSDIADFNENYCCALVNINANSFFYEKTNGVPSYVGIEYMAQTIAAWVGIQGRQQGRAPKIGFLLGTRKYNAQVYFFKNESCLYIRAELVYREGPLGVFKCEIECENELLATANVNVYQPDSPEELMK